MNNNITKVFAALSLPIRLDIFRILVANHIEGICPCDIAKQLNIPRNTLSFHLSAMHHAGICTFQKKGKCLFYTPNCKLIHDVASFLMHKCTVYNEFSKDLKNV